METGNTPNDTLEIGDLLRSFRAGKMTQRELADAIGVTDGLIGNVERGTRNLGRENAEKVADALGLSKRERGELLAARDRYREGRDYNRLVSNVSEETRRAIDEMIAEDIARDRS